MESFGIVLIEALSAGVPVLAPAVGGIPEVITDGTDGYLWDITDVEGSTTKLILLLDDEGLRLRMGFAGRAKYIRQFRTDHLAPTLYSFLVAAEGRYHPTPTRIAPTPHPSSPRTLVT